NALTRTPFPSRNSCSSLSSSLPVSALPIPCGRSYLPYDASSVSCAIGSTLGGSPHPCAFLRSARGAAGRKAQGGEPYSAVLSPTRPDHEFERNGTDRGLGCPKRRREVGRGKGWSPGSGAGGGKRRPEMAMGTGHARNSRADRVQLRSQVTVPIRLTISTV